MARLIMRRGPNHGMIYPLEGEVVTIGRGSKNDIIIHDNEISREHCRLVRNGSDYLLEDLNSSNGSFVNAMRVGQIWPLRHGAYIELGEAVAFEYERDEADAPAADDTQETNAYAAVQQDEAEADETPETFALRMTAGPERGRIFTLTQPVIKLGRDLKNDIVIQDPEVSRSHAQLRRSEGHYEIQDMGSTNGTRLNDTLITGPTPLQAGDIIFLGTSVHLQYATDQALADAQITDPRPTEEDLRAYFNDTQYIALERTRVVPPAASALGTGLEPAGLEEHVFLAYARDDWERFVASMTVKLQDAGLKVWVEQYLTPGGEDWREAIRQAQTECWLMVVVMSPRLLTQDHLKAAYRYFINHDKPVIPLVYEPMMTLPIELARQRVILHDRKNPRRSVDKLIYEIKEMRKQMRP